MYLISVHNCHKKLWSVKYYLKNEDRIEKVLLDEYRAKLIISTFKLLSNRIFETDSKFILKYSIL